MGTKKRLGRGFESIIPTDLVDEDFDPTAREDERMSKLIEIPLEKVKRDEDQPRKEFSEEGIKALSRSIKINGVLQPIVVTKEGNEYKIVAGERRYRAAKLAGLETIPAIVRTLDAQNRLELSIIENAQREDLNAIELATAYAKLKTQFNLGTREIAERIGKSESSVVNTLRLLNLPDFVKKAMIENNLSEGVVRPLITVDKTTAEYLLMKIIEEEWPARRVEEYIKGTKKKSSAAIIKENTFKEKEEKFAKKFQAKRVKITNKSITITFKNNKELEKLLETLEG